MTLVRYESAGHVATITMARIEAHNALNNALCDELRQAWLRFRDSDDRVAVLADRKRRALRVHLPKDVDAGLKSLDQAVSSAIPDRR